MGFLTLGEVPVLWGQSNRTWDQGLGARARGQLRTPGCCFSSPAAARTACSLSSVHWCGGRSILG